MADLHTKSEVINPPAKNTSESVSNAPTLPASTVQLAPIEAAKRLAAFAAVDNHIRKDHKIIGIGSGSTVPYVVDRIKEQGPEANLGRIFIPTGFQSKELIVSAGLTLGDLEQYPSIDVTIDGADEVDANLQSIKGGGACQLREKVLAEAAETWVIVADYRKNSSILGTTWKQGVPIEVAQFAYSAVLLRLQKLGAIKAGLRMGKMKAGPVVTDNGGFVIDAVFPEEIYLNPAQLLTDIKLLTGVVEVGLFVDLAKAAYFGNEDGSVTARWADGREEKIEASL
ncbi:ribose-5-phosphate isomerase [Phaffia rhodozyma]|uniref:Ribose-5-phosphate isomerase n=1 Tax=Phaffia rhodozyma TaxID=264483 RepID=A0A0F7SIG7_PHARH|nr:ribose-5-phosphate isomerase [Phaffia rhodozyma]